MYYPILAQTPVSYVYSQFSKHEISRSRLLIEIVLPLEQCHMLHLGKPNYDSKYSNSVVIQRILLCLNFYCYCNYRFCWTLLAHYPILQSQFESTSIVETGEKTRLARTFETWNYRNCFLSPMNIPKPNRQSVLGCCATYSSPSCLLCTIGFWSQHPTCFRLAQRSCTLPLKADWPTMPQCPAHALVATAHLCWKYLGDHHTFHMVAYVSKIFQNWAALKSRVS